MHALNNPFPGGAAKISEGNGMPAAPPAAMKPLAKPHPHRKDYTDAEKDAGLTALALYSGHRDRAAEALRAAGTPVPASTLNTWRRDNPERYEAAQRKAMPQVKARLADMHEGLVQAAGNIEARLLEKLASEMHELQPKELSGAVKNVAITSGIHSEKGLLFRGEPTQIIEKDRASIERALAKHGFVIDGTATEVESESNGVSASPPASRPESREQKQLSSGTDA